MTQLVIGAGLVGRSLVAYLLEKGETVRVFDLAPCTGLRAETMTGDVRNPQDVARACAGVDTVYHTASMVSQGLGEVSGMYAVNVTGTQHVIAACQQADTQGMLKSLRQQRVGWSVFVHPGKLERFFSSIGHHWVGVRHREFATIQDAIDFIREDATLPEFTYDLEALETQLA
jgi:hypothetical protein